MTNDSEIIVLLTSIDLSLKTLVMIAQKRKSVTTPTNDAICNGPHGDPVIKAKDPRDWAGEPMTGRNFSQCPPDYLDLLADRFDYFASREEDPKKRNYNQLDAKRARAWAVRKRAGWTAPTSAQTSPTGEPEW